MGEDITVSPFYHSCVNEITKPNSLVFTSHYFVDRWMRDLGPVGAAVVTVLRSHCYQNRAKGELRNRIQLPVSQIAAEVGVSAKTVRREMADNKVLQKFVQRREEYAPGPTPQSLRTDAYSYLVAMDDPVHPLDDGLLQEAIQEKINRMEKGGGEGDAKARARQRQEFEAQKQQAAKVPEPPRQIDHTAESRLDELSTPPGQIDQPRAKLSTPPGQIDHALIDSSDSLEFIKNPSSDFSLALFGGDEASDQKEPQSVAPQRWQDLTPAEQQPFTDQARAELEAIHAGSGITPRPILVEVRAKNLYETSQKGGGE